HQGLPPPRGRRLRRAAPGDVEARCVRPVRGGGLRGVRRVRRGPLHDRLDRLHRRGPRHLRRRLPQVSAALITGWTSLWDLIEQRAAATPDARFAIDENDRALTFAEYRDACERAA